MFSQQSGETEIKMKETFLGNGPIERHQVLSKTLQTIEVIDQSVGSFDPNNEGLSLTEHTTQQDKSPKYHRKSGATTTNNDQEL